MNVNYFVNSIDNEKERISVQINLIQYFSFVVIKDQMSRESKPVISQLSFATLEHFVTIYVPTLFSNTRAFRDHIRVNNFPV